MVGRSVLNECLASEKVSGVLVVNRKSLDYNHAKLEEVLHQDFTDFSSIASRFEGYDACYHCMGVSSIGKSEEEFSLYTYTMTKSLADACYEANKDMVMTYVSGDGTDSTEQGRTMWARVKGKTENYILNKGFKDAYMFRLGALIPTKGIKSGTIWYQLLYDVLRPFYPLLKKIDTVTTSEKIGKAMINAVHINQELKHLENKDINALSRV